MSVSEEKSLWRVFVENISTGLSKALSKSWLVIIFFFVFYYIYLSIIELAGKETTADINVLWDVVIDTLSAEKPSWILWFTVLTFAILCLGWALLERKSKRDHIEELAPFREKYEKLLDENRTSSGLDKRGKSINQ